MKCEIIKTKVEIAENVEYNDIFEDNEKQIAVVKLYKELLRNREILLSTTHQTNDGPYARDQLNSVAATLNCVNIHK